MPIEFRCQQCSKLLRINAAAAGQQAKCPSCGTSLTIPGGAAPPADTLFDGSVPDPLLDAIPLAPLAREDNNPYRPPVASTYAAASYGRATPAQRRSGPPWERDGMSPISFVKTIFQIHTSPIRFFSTMRREDGIGSPMIFYMSVSAIAMTEMLFFGPFSAILGQALGRGNFLADYPIILVPIIVLASALNLLMGAGINHIGLSMVGAANESYDTTFRVIAYSSASMVLVLVPVVGLIVASLLNNVLIVIGLAYAHDTKIWRVIAGLLAPGVLCFGLVFGGLFLFGLVRSEMAPPNRAPADPRRFQVQLPADWRPIRPIARELEVAPGAVFPLDLCRDATFSLHGVHLHRRLNLNGVY